VSLRVVGETCGAAAIRLESTQLGILGECCATCIHRQQRHCDGCNTQDSVDSFLFHMNTPPSKDLHEALGCFESFPRSLTRSLPCPRGSATSFGSKTRGVQNDRAKSSSRAERIPDQELTARTKRWRVGLAPDRRFKAALGQDVPGRKGRLEIGERLDVRKMGVATRPVTSRAKPSLRSSPSLTRCQSIILPMLFEPKNVI
jgi:hypothetical protein